MSEMIKYDVGTCKFRLRRDGVERYCSFIHADGKNSLVKAYDFLDRILDEHAHLTFMSVSGDLYVKYRLLDDDGKYREPPKGLVVSPDDYIVVVYKQRVMNSDEFDIDHLVSLDGRGFHGLFSTVVPTAIYSPRESIYPRGCTKIKIDTERAFDILCELNKGGFVNMIQAFQITPSGIEQLLRHNTLYTEIQIGRPNSPSKIMLDPSKNFKFINAEKNRTDTISIAVTVGDVTYIAGNDDVLMFGDINKPIKGFSREEFNKFMRSGKAPADIKVYN